MVNKKKRSKDRMNTQVMFFLVMLAAILISFFVFSYIFNKSKDPCFDYYGYKACKVALQGTNIIFYSIPVTFKVAGMNQENNVVIRTDPREIENLGIKTNLPSFFLKTRPLIMYVTMDPESNSKTVAAAYEIVKFVGNLEFPAVMAFTKSSGTNETNVITCEQATNAQRVVWMKYLEMNGSSEKLSSVSVSPDNPYCIIVESNSYDGLIEASDAFVLEWLLRINEKKQDDTQI